ncbi:MAG: GAF domain-containing protein, partial [Anaerolineae bacterium]|nr:GAF domain-containing protein [Anaerolineae bacterium]
PFDEMLDIVLQELCRVVEAEMGYVMLYDQEGKQLEMRAATHDDLLQKVAYYETMTQIANKAIRRTQLVCEDVDAPRCTIMAVPLILRNEVIGVFGAVNRDPKRRFTSDHRRLLKAIVSQMDTAIFESLEQRRLRRVLGRSVDTHVLDRILANPSVDLLKGERVVLSVLYGDLRGSTELAQQLRPEMLVEFINGYLGRMAQVLYAYEGTLDKFIGDEVMALFGAPLPQLDHPLRAVRVGLAMQNAHQQYMADWTARGIKPAALGIGIATGEVTVGEFGCEQRTDYTIIGHTANLGARICGVAAPDEVLISQETYDLIRDEVEVTPRSGVHLKGIDHAVTVYAVDRLLY